MSDSILQWLRSQFINVPRDWVDACVQWINEENEGRRLDKSFLQRQVYEQWLSVDLSELNNAVLPQEVMEPKYTLKGTFCLQINSILDISQPCYAQLNKIQNVDDRNTMVSAETQPTQVWKESANRMLMMKLTDGVNEVNGMEYQKISSLCDTIPPGTKVKIKGPVMCRRGVLMLLPSNIQLLGGEVEDMLATNRKEAVLCRALNRPVPAPNTNQPSNSTNMSANQPINNNQNDFDLPDDLISQLTDDDFTFPDSGYHTASHNASSSTTNYNLSSTNSVSSSSNNHYSNQNINTPHNAPKNISSKNDNVVIDDELEDFEMLLEIENLEKESNSHRTASSTISTIPNRESYQTPNTSAHINSISRQDSKTKINSSSRQISIKDAFAQKFKTASDVLHTNKSTTKTATVTPILPTLPNNISNSLNDNDFESDEECPSLYSRFKKEEKSKLPLTSDNNNSLSHAFVLSSKTDNFKSKLLKYICQAKKKVADGESCFAITVKAFILTLLSKLQIEESIIKGWVLKARICDGTDNLDVFFSDQVLTQLIGFTALKANKIRKERNPRDLLLLKAGMENCRNQLVEMCKLMNIQFSSTSMPCVTQILE